MVSSDSTQKRKLNVSMMLKVPIDLEIEVLELPSINQHTDEQKENQTRWNLIEAAEPEIIVNGAKLADLDENSQAMVAQIVSQLQQKDHIVTPVSSTQEQQDNLVNDEQEIRENYKYINTDSLPEFAVIQPQIPPEPKKIKVRFLDSINDAFAFGVNTMATILFLGKLANYSWD